MGSPSALLVDRRLGHHRDAEEAEVAEEVEESRSDPKGCMICVRIHSPSATSFISEFSAVPECPSLQMISQTDGEPKKDRHAGHAGGLGFCGL